MRVLMAVMVLSLGMVSVWAGGKGLQQGPKRTQVGTKQKSVSQPNTDSNQRKSSPPSPPQEGTDFYGSWIDPKARFVWINPGTFQMGSIEGTDPDRYKDEVPHRVTLNRGFWLLDHEVTQREYEWVMGNNPSRFTGDAARPVEQVSWYDAVAFCKKLTDLDRSLKKIGWDQAYRLPTEAEWEYAARAGSTGARYTVDGLGPADSLNEIAWWDGNSDSKTHAVRGKKPNAWGLYDMLGNVWEWCSDWYGDYPSGDVTDPKGPSSGTFRVGRGGSLSSDARRARSANRERFIPGGRGGHLGFRPALSSVR
jgi:formylglycine-generating enzyme required for sulfatase activity